MEKVLPIHTRYHHDVGIADCPYVNTLRTEQNGRYFADVLNFIFLNENCCNFIQIVQLTFKAPLVLTKVCCRSASKALPQPVMALFTAAYYIGLCVALVI